MRRYLKLIWFFEDEWTTYHAAIGVNAQKTLCGIYRSTRAILPSEKYKSNMPRHKCCNCRAVLKRRYGSENIEKVKV